MTTRMARIVGALMIVVMVGVGCVGPNGQLAGETFARGLGYLLLSPLMIVTGIIQGLAFLPYTLGLGLAELNRSLLEAQAVSLDDSYKSTFGVSMTDPRVDQKTGQVAGEGLGFGRYRPGAIREATERFQALLVSQGMPEATARHYVIGANYRHTRSQGHILLVVMYRHSAMQTVRVHAKHTGIVTTFRPEQTGWFEPYRRDVSGQLVDEIVDWAGIEYGLLRQDKVVAVLMSLAAEAVKSGKRADDYWNIEQRWMAGQNVEIIRESAARVKLDQVRQG